MSDSKDIKEKKINEETNNEDTNPILLLPKDLINHLDSLNESNLEIKKDINRIKDKDRNKIKDINNKHEKLIFSNNFEDGNENKAKNKINNFPINQNDIRNFNVERKDNMNSFYGCNQQLTNNNLNIPNFNKQYNKKSFPFNMNECPSFSENNNNNFLNNIKNNNYINNNNSIKTNNNINRIIFMNSCFSMNGKTGWICTSCKNFNYQSKFIYIIINVLFIQYK